jgi:hypothetical protein
MTEPECMNFWDLYWLAVIGIVGAGLVFAIAIGLFIAVVSVYDRVKEARHRRRNTP